MCTGLRAGLHCTVSLVLFPSKDGPRLKFCQGLQQPGSSADPVTALVPPFRAATLQPCGLSSISVYVLIPGLSLLQVRDFAGTNITTNTDSSGEMDSDVQGYNTFLILNLNWSSLCCTTAKYFSQNSLDLLTNSLLLTGYRGWKSFLGSCRAPFSPPAGNGSSRDSSFCLLLPFVPH